VALDLSRPSPLCPPFPINPNLEFRITFDVRTWDARYRLHWAVFHYLELHKDVFGSLRPRNWLLGVSLLNVSELWELVAEVEAVNDSLMAIAAEE